jgi:aspartyl-tRNA(Asn)/glutamyl-tRNA(Gln) amidotransferase subunit B
MNRHPEYELIVGLEIHAQLRTKSKAFCADEVTYGGMPNTVVSAISLGYPGTLPVHNKEAVNSAIKLGLACKSSITKENRYSRKNYFYADLPKGYQITQFDTPICIGGGVEITLSDGSSKVIDLTRIHMEEDTGKSIHDLDIENTLMDYNRAGTPLVEIVTEPVIRDSEEAYQFLTEVRKLVRYLEICDGNMEEGSLRCDANISVRKYGETEFRTKVEVKNMNSISNVKRAIEHEYERQVQMALNGENAKGETRNFDAMSGTTKPMRSKELVNDYRYFPEPDLPPLIVDESWVAEIKSTMPKLAKELFESFTTKYQLSNYDAQNLTDDKNIAAFFLEICEHTTNYKSAANWVMGSVKKWMNTTANSIEVFPLSAKQIADIILNIDNQTITNSIAEQQLFPELLDNPTAKVDEIIQKLGLKIENDDAQLIKVIEEVFSEFPDKVESYKAGNKNLLGLFIGQVMRKTGGKASPQVTNKLLVEMLKS